MASSWPGYGPSAPSQAPSAAESRSKKAQSRQLLSCTKCRERKVKCDRTKPCSACCARGHPKECEFIVGEGNDYSPIQQSYEIRKLRAENQRLKERLQAARLGESDDEDDDDGSQDRQASKTASRAASARQRRFKTGDRVDNLYFGTPGLANIVSDFASLQVGGHGSQSLTHTMPKAKDLYAIDQQPSYPFPVIAKYSTVAALLQLLPLREELFACLELFQRRAQSCSFPHTPDEVTKKEVARFLADAERNANNFPDMLALIFATLATGLQMGQYDRSGGQWVKGAVEGTRNRSDAFLTASMQALRLASFMNRPTILGIQTLVMMGPYLTNSGRFLDAYTLFGTTIRLAHSIGLHRKPELLDPAPPLRECTIRQTLWWWMLHMDQQYSVTLGRPLGISGFGDCPPPEPLTTNPTMLRLGEFVDHFTILARQILSSDGLMSVAKIDEFTDKMIGLWDTMPAALQFNESWSQQGTSLPEWPLEVMSATLFAKVQSFLIILNRQRVERTQSAAPCAGSPHESIGPLSRSYSGMAVPTTGMYPLSEHASHAAPVRGRDLVIQASISIVQAFLFFFHRNPAVLICWTMGQQAYNACMILLIDAWETGNEQNWWLIEQAYVTFQELEEKGVHQLAQLAVERISDGLGQLGQRRAERERQMASFRRSSGGPQPLQQRTMLTLDTASMMDWSGDTVMGNTGTYLLEDSGLQSFVPQSFRPLGWNMAGSSAHPSNPSNPPTPNIPSPAIPVSQVIAAPFPVMSPPMVPVTNSPFAVGLQPRMPSGSQRRSSSLRHGQPFTPINTSMLSTSEQPDPQEEQQRRRSQPQQQSFSQFCGPRHSSHPSGSSSSSAGPRGIHRLDKPPKSLQRRKQ